MELVLPFNTNLNRHLDSQLSLEILEFDRLTELLENAGQIDVMYTDLEKAYGKIPHKRFISKLFSYGINKKILVGLRLF